MKYPNDYLSRRKQLFVQLSYQAWRRRYTVIFILFAPDKGAVSSYLSMAEEMIWLYS
jgi:hypothetical protein